MSVIIIVVIIKIEEERNAQDMTSWWKYWRTALSNIHIHYFILVLKVFIVIISSYLIFWHRKTPLGCLEDCAGTLDKLHVRKEGIILTQALRGCVDTTRWLHKGVHQANIENGYTSSTNAAWVWGCAICADHLSRQIIACDLGPALLEAGYFSRRGYVWDWIGWLCGDSLILIPSTKYITSFRMRSYVTK